MAKHDVPAPYRLAFSFNLRDEEVACQRQVPVHIEFKQEIISSHLLTEIKEQIHNLPVWVAAVVFCFFYLEIFLTLICNVTAAHRSLKNCRCSH